VFTTALSVKTVIPLHVSQYYLQFIVNQHLVL